MSNPIILVITALVFCICSGTMGAGTEVAEGTGESGWGQLTQAPEEVQVIGRIVKEWFGAYLVNDLAHAKELYVPSKREQAEEGCLQSNQEK